MLLLQSDTSASDLRMEDELEGFRVVAACLKSLGVTHMFGVVGIPVVEVVLLAKMCYDEIETRCHFFPRWQWLRSRRESNTLG